MRHHSFILFLLVLLCFIPRTTFADTYEIRFLFSADTLQFDSDTNEPVSINPNKVIYLSDFFQEQSTGPYMIVFYDVTSEEIARKQFSPIKEKFSLEVPYFSTAKTLVVKKTSSGDHLLTYNLESFVECNGNGVCEYEKGEDDNTCLSDCASSSVQYSTETLKILKQNNFTLRDPKTGEVILQIDQQKAPIQTTPDQRVNTLSRIILFTIGFILIGWIVVIIFQKRRSKDN